jgi:hypothetical protein
MNVCGCVFVTSIYLFVAEMYSFNFFTTLAQSNPGTLTAPLNEMQQIKNHHPAFL